jgi:multidrug efflux pump subunit AcrA (membrane-fusion protein)
MTIRRPKPGLLFLCAALAFAACGGHREGDEDLSAGTPVTITHVSTGRLEETVELNAVSAFLLKTSVKSTVAGYLQDVRVSYGQHVHKGEELFTIRSKEAQALGGAADSLLDVRAVRILSPADGYVTQLNYRPGDYVQDGEAILSISDRGSLTFLLDLPYELRAALAANREVVLQLPDGGTLSGRLGAPLPSVDPASQTMSVRIAVAPRADIPENLIAKVRLLLRAREHAVSLPREALCTDEAQKAWWIMRLVNDSTAVRVDIGKGLETRERVEILAPLLNADDRIVLTGQYGLPDTARIAIRK